LGSMAHRVIKGLVGGCAVLLGVTISGCAAPQFTYVANSSQNTYFKIPSGWHKIGSAALAAELQAQVGSGDWIVAYEPGAKPTAGDFGSVKDAQPFVFAAVTTLTASASSDLSYNTLRDLILPVTATARSDAAAQGTALAGFQQLRDQVLTPGQGVHGVRETYDYTFGNVSDTFDEIALTNADQTVLYLLYVHCTTKCYSHDQSQINEVMSSFTVRSP
jgi:hypothetical protein